MGVEFVPATSSSMGGEISSSSYVSLRSWKEVERQKKVRHRPFSVLVKAIAAFSCV